jgi:uncharacterized membrane protein
MFGFRRSPFRFVWILLGALLVAFVLVGIGSFVFALLLGRSPFYFAFPFLAIGFLFLTLLFAGGILFRLAFFRRWRRYYYYRYDPALQTLRERYARGEITRDQLRDMTRDLREERS